MALTSRLQAEPGPVRLRYVAEKVGKYQKVEFDLQIPRAYTNAFDPDEVEVNLRLTGPLGEKMIIPAFYLQNYERRRVGAVTQQKDWFYPLGAPVWKARFAPMWTGEYSAVAVVKDRLGTVSSTPVAFHCFDSSSRGFVRVSRRDPRFLEFSEGQACFPIGQNLAFIGSQQYVTLSKAEEIFGKLSANGANYLRIWTCCEDWAIALEARKSAWGRSWDRRPPIVPVPGAEKTGRQCLKLSASRATLEASPSHPVALRPATRYLVSAKIRTEGDASLLAEVNRIKSSQPLTSEAGEWTSFQQEFETGSNDFWFPGATFRLQGTNEAWLADLSLKEASGGPELLWEADVNRPVRGFYNPLDCFLLDELVSAAEKHGILLQLCLLTRDLYMEALKDPTSPEYGRAIKDASKLFRYAVARWGYSTSVAAWEYWNEMNPGLPTDEFYAALGEYLEQMDPYDHPRTTSTWGPSAKDCRHEKLDIADTHFYLRPTDKGQLEDEVHAVIDRTRWLRDQAPAKPAHLGEFGLADDKWAITPEMKRSSELADMHNALWASALSGGSGTAMFWWWERLDQHNFYPEYRPLSQFISGVPWTSGKIKPAEVTASAPRLRVMGLEDGQTAWVWLFDREASWNRIVLENQAPQEVVNAELEVKTCAPGEYRVVWWDTRKGVAIREKKQATRDSTLRVAIPNFSRDIACTISRR